MAESSSFRLVSVLFILISAAGRDWVQLLYKYIYDRMILQG